MTKIYQQWFADMLAKTPLWINRLVDVSSDIAVNIDDTLAAKGMNQKDLAKLLGKKDSQISKWLAGKHNFTLKTIFLIEEVIGIKLIYSRQEAAEIESRHSREVMRRMMHFEPRNTVKYNDERNMISSIKIQATYNKAALSGNQSSAYSQSLQS